MFGYALNVAVARFPKPYLQILVAITLGGGVGITIHGSHRVATANTVFAMPETEIGQFRQGTNRRLIDEEMIAELRIVWRWVNHTDLAAMNRLWICA